jgi:hypothetical protein
MLKVPSSKQKQKECDLVKQRGTTSSTSINTTAHGRRHPQDFPLL